MSIICSTSTIYVINIQILASKFVWLILHSLTLCMLGDLNVFVFLLTFSEITLNKKFFKE